MALYIYTEHSITDSVKLRYELVTAGDIEPEFSINTDVYIESELSKETIDQVVVDAAD